MKRVLITGASSFIGRHCLSPLLAKGYEVHAVSSKPLAKPKLPGVYWHQANLLAGQASDFLISVRPTHLLHLAWYAVPGKFWASPENLRWVQSSIELVRAFAECDGQRVVMAGSCAEYDWRHDLCSEDITPLVPSTLYGVCKHALHIILEAFARHTGLSAAWGRIFFLYGTHESPERLVASVIRAILQNEPARCSHGRQIRDFLYSQDAGEAFVALLDSEVVGAVNIASGFPVAIREVVTRIGEKLGRRDLIQIGALPAPGNDPPVLLADVRRLVEEVGWRPQYDLDRGLDTTIEWWKQHVQEKPLSG